MTLTPGQEKIIQWRRNPNTMVSDLFGVTPDLWQQDVLSVFPSQDRDKLRIALKAAVGPGKSACLAWLGWAFLLCYADKGQHPKGAALSVTWDNLRDNLWAEFARWYQRSPLLQALFDMTSEKIFAREHPSTWFISARSFNKNANAEEQGLTLSGLHAPFVLVLIDECGEIPPSVLRKGEQALSNIRWGKIIIAGNPTSHEGMLYEATTTNRDQWTVIEITGDPDDPKRSPRINKEWAAEQIAKYGRDNPWVMSAILGKFPPTSLNSLLGVEEVIAAMGRDVKEDAYAFSQKRMGVDCARFGDDASVIFPRQGLVAFPVVEMRNARTTEIAARVMMAKEKWGSEMEFVDDTGGYGAGVIDALIQAKQSPIPVSFSGKADDPRFYNKRTEMWWRMAEWVKRGGSLPDDKKLVRELSAPTYTFQDGKFRLEEKAQIKERVGYSPDRGDALCLSFSMHDMPTRAHEFSRAIAAMQGRSNRALTDFDPIERR